MRRVRPLPADSDSSPESSSCADSSSSSPGGPRPFQLRVHLASCKYPVLRVVQRQLGWVKVADEDAHLFWCDTSAGTERLARLARPQRLNHFPGMLEIARKKGLARNLGNMRALFPQHYDFAPPTYLLPEQMEAFMAELAAGQRAAKGGRGSGGSSSGGSGGGSGRHTWILKLDNGSMGRGIKLVQTPAQAAEALPTFEHEQLVACRYVDRPLLINGLKFDLRIYVLVRCCNPLRVFVCREGLVRFCTQPYSPPAAANLASAYTHLTNYAVNKSNPDYQFNQDAEHAGQGSKWTISALAEWMRGAGHDWDGLWRAIKHLIAKSLIAVQPMLQYQYDCATRPDDDGLTCFELLGYDVLVDESLRPWLLEVNHSPSLTTDTPLDLELKEALELAGVQPERVRAELAARERAKQQRLYSGHAACVTHAPAAAPDAGAAAAAAAPAPVSAAGASGGSQAAAEAAAGEAAPAASSGTTSSAQESSGQSAGAEASPAAALAAPPSEPAAGAAAASTAGGCCLLGPAVEPQRGSAEWLAAQTAYEDAHLGRFERVMPPDDPQLAALYEELLGGALQAFYRSTMQGRNQQRLNEIKERRAAEEAEARAREDALARRAEGLRAWMAGVCARHRQEREQRAAATEAAAAAAGVASGVAAGDSDSGRLPGGVDSWSDTDSDAGAIAFLQQHLAQQQQPQHFAAARQALATPAAPAAAAPSASAQVPCWRVGHGGGEPGARQPRRVASNKEQAAAICSLSVVGKSAAAASCASDSARTSGAGGPPTGEGSGSGSRRRPLSAAPLTSRPQPVTVESVIEQRRAAAAAAGAAGAAGLPAKEGSMLPSRPQSAQQLSRPGTSGGSAALAAWEALSRRQSNAVEAATAAALGRGAGQPAPAPEPWQQAAWEAYGRPPGARPPSSCGHFLQRVATFTAAQQATQAAAAQAADRARSELAGLSLHSSYTSLAGSAGSGSSSGGSGGGLCTPQLDSFAGPAEGGDLAATYIPPAMLSALHTVRMSPRLLSSLRAPAPAGGTHQQLPRRGPAGGWQPAAPLSGAQASPSGSPNGGRKAAGGRITLDAPLTAAAGGRPSPPKPQRASLALPPEAAAARGSPTGAAAGAPAAAAAATALGAGGSGRGRAAERQQYREAVQQQAVLSVAALISDLIRERKL